MRLAVVLVAFCAVVSNATATVRAYSIAPQRADQSGWTHRAAPGDWVGQYVVCTWDSLSYPARVELFTGDIGGEGRYNLDVKDSATSTLLAHKYNVANVGSHKWLPFDTLDIDGPFVKGRTVLFSFTRESPDSIHYYFAEDPNNPAATGPYKYGQMIVGGTGQAV